MGLEEMVNGKSAVPEQVTVAELIHQYGEEPVRRGLAYMSSLSDADVEYRESVDPQDFSEGLERAGVSGDKDGVSSKWARRSSETGIFGDDDED